MLSEAYDTEMLLQGVSTDFDDWCQDKCAEQPSFKFLFMIMRLVIIHLVLILSFGEELFEAYKVSLATSIPFLFVNDNTHYSRWGTSTVPCIHFRIIYNYLEDHLMFCKTDWN